MRRAITYTHPKVALTGETRTWKFVYTSAVNLSKGARLKFDLESQGREFDWQVPQVNLKKQENLIWMEIPSQKVVEAREVAIPKSSLPQFEFTLPEEVKAGEEVAIFMGTPNKEEEQIKGNRSQFHLFRRRAFQLYVDPKGKGEYKECDTFHLDVRGNCLHAIRVVCPSIIGKNQRFDVVVRFEDRYGNLTGNAPKDTLIAFSYERLRENINWKLFVPETGFINLPNLYFNEEGVYRIKLTNLKTKESFFSDPIKCFLECERPLYWGRFHGETIFYNATSSIESCLRHIRDEEALQFFASSPFEKEEETSPEVWKGISSYIAEFNEDERFTTFLGFQWEGTPNEEGLRQLLYFKDNKPLLRRKESKGNNLKKIYKSHTTKDFLSIPTFTMGKESSFDFENFSPEYERVVEIYNAWGSSECTKAEGNPRPITSTSKKGVREVAEGSIRRALNRNCRFGFVAGGLDDRGCFKEFFDNKQTQYSPGLTAVLSKNHTREGIIQALNRRSCYATTGPRIIAGLYVANHPMGSELNTKAKPGLLYNRHLSGHVVGLKPIKEVLLIRNGSPLRTFTPKDVIYDFTFDDDEMLDKIALKGGEELPPFIYYYMRVEQEDGHLAWTSPIWVDLGSLSLSEKKKK